MDNHTVEIINALAGNLTGRGWRLGAAESCTGGLVGALCTSQPGSSGWFTGGIISYSDEIKRKILGVPENLIREYGAVSEPVVEAMLRGALKVLECDCAIAISGVAGPDGGTVEKPVGTVVFGVARPSARGTHAPTGHDILVTTRVFPGNRAQVRRSAAVESLHVLRDYTIREQAAAL